LWFLSFEIAHDGGAPTAAGGMSAAPAAATPSANTVSLLIRLPSGFMPSLLDRGGTEAPASIGQRTRGRRLASEDLCRIALQGADATYSPSAPTLWPRRVGTQASVRMSWRAAAARYARPQTRTPAPRRGCREDCTHFAQAGFAASDLPRRFVGGRQNALHEVAFRLAGRQSALCDSVRGRWRPPLRNENPNAGSPDPPQGLALPAEGAGLRVDPRQQSRRRANSLTSSRHLHASLA